MNNEFQLEATGNIQLFSERASKKRRVTCKDGRRCRMIQCEVCRKIRRDVFTYSGNEFIKTHNVYWFMTISRIKRQDVVHESHNCPWYRLRKLNDDLKRGTSGKIGKFIKSFGIGSEECAHAHFIVTEGGRTKMLNYLNKRKNRAEFRIHSKPIIKNEEFRVLGYLFDKNYLPLATNPERPRFFRVLSASRGVVCGYPKKNKEKITQIGLFKEQSKGDLQ